MAADAHDAGPAGAFKTTHGAADAHDAGQAGAFQQHTGQLMLMMLGRLGLLGNRRGS